MSDVNSNTNQNPQTVPFSEKVGKWIEDPFASAIMATVMTASAVGVVLTGMTIINVAIY